METIDKICMKLQRTVRFRSTWFLSKRFNDIILSSSAMYEMKELRFNYLIRTGMARLKFRSRYTLYLFLTAKSTLLYIEFLAVHKSTQVLRESRFQIGHFRRKYQSDRVRRKQKKRAEEKRRQRRRDSMEGGFFSRPLFSRRFTIVVKKTSSLGRKILTCQLCCTRDPDIPHAERANRPGFTSSHRHVTQLSDAIFHRHKF